MTAQESAPASSAAIIAIGSELLGPLRQDTNSLWLTARLEELGIPTSRKSIVADDEKAIRDELDTVARTVRYVFTTGGLGPTADDVTVAAVAHWLGAGLKRDEAFLENMRRRFERRGYTMAECNAKQADFIVGARVLPNPRGTAPGFWAQKGGIDVVLLPGVPSEMKEIMEDVVLPALRERAGNTVGRRRVLRIAGMGESAVEELVAPVYAEWKDDPVTILASPGEVQLHLFTRGEPSAAEAKLAAMERGFRAVLGDRIYGADADELAAVVGTLLRNAGKTLALAESCTGGLASTMLTDVPGSSQYFLGAVVSYANAVKQELLGVRARRCGPTAPCHPKRPKRWRPVRGSASEPTSPWRSPESRAPTAAPPRSRSGRCTSRWPTTTARSPPATGSSSAIARSCGERPASTPSSSCGGG